MWWITFETYHWCFEVAKASNYDPLAIGACFGILTPVSALQGAVIKFYGDQSQKRKELERLGEGGPLTKQVGANQRV